MGRTVRDISCEHYFGRVVKSAEGIPCGYEYGCLEGHDVDKECGIYCIAGYVCALLFMPSLKVAMFIWGLCCAIDNIGWLVVYHKNKEKFMKIETEE